MERELFWNLNVKIIVINTKIRKIFFSICK